MGDNLYLPWFSFLISIHFFLCIRKESGHGIQGTVYRSQIPVWQIPRLGQIDNFWACETDPGITYKPQNESSLCMPTILHIDIVSYNICMGWNFPCQSQIPR